MKRLIPAIALLLISAVLMSTASYAWFTLNTLVTATDMKVEAKTSQNLVISNVNTASTFKETAAATNNTKAELNPVSTADLENWYTLSSDGQSKILFQTGKNEEEEFAAEDISKVTVNTQYYYYTDFFIKVSGHEDDEFDNLYVSNIEVLGEGEAISNSLRVGVMVFNGDAPDDTRDFHIFSPNGEQEYEAVEDEDGSLVEIEASTTGDLATLGKVTTDALKVRIFLWYEGQDKDNTSQNAIVLDELDITVEFSAV